VVLTGAGLSTASGIPDFRSDGGLWTQIDPTESAHIDVWRKHPQRFWSFYRQRLDIPDTFSPNAAHYALAELYANKEITAVITQNIDGLQQKAGLKDVIELHGSVRTLVCECGSEYKRENAWPLFAENGVPYCPLCARVLKPDVTLFGENLPRKALARAYGLAYACDLMLVVGSSLSVYPAAELPAYAAAGGATTVCISHESEYDEFADLCLHGEIVAELTGVVEALRTLSSAKVAVFDTAL
jgi:NAD-dependent deacetylase